MEALLQYAVAIAQAHQDKDYQAIRDIDWNIRLPGRESLPILIDRQHIDRLWKAKVRVRYSLTGLAC